MIDLAKTETFNDLCGEFIGTFILVFFGCGSIAVTVLFSALSGLFQIATIWGIAVTLVLSILPDMYLALI